MNQIHSEWISAMLLGGALSIVPLGGICYPTIGYNNYRKKYISVAASSIGLHWHKLVYRPSIWEISQGG